ncbi:hypothetical protein [Flavobacterium sp. FlaQc-48]|uniref:hypothetical protein n=1 Tax=Flavobacterium sp. FlaQc-48 TaxID=3374181 RepID=UPI0037578002
MPKIIDTVREKLSERPKSILFCKLGNKATSIPDGLKSYTAYSEFLSVCNGARCGDIDLWDTNSIPNNQFYVSEIQGMQDAWLCIGQILYEPLMLSKQDGKVYLFSKNELNDMPMYIFDDFYNLIINYVFGVKYKNIVVNADNDRWFIFLKENDFFSINDV